MQEDSREHIYIDRRLERACRYVSDFWFPINEGLLTHIKVGLKEGRYDDRPAMLLREIREDFSLFMHCARELARMVRTRDPEHQLPANPFELLAQAELAELRTILETDEHTLSRHKLSTMSPLQTKRVEEVLLSASASEVLCQAERLDPDVGFSLSLLRQLGMTLIAFNYPSVYEQAVAKLKGSQTLDTAIAGILGYSPSLLAMRLLRSWGFPQETMAALDEEAGQEYDELLGVAADSYVKICKVGEALARANNPETYPEAEHDWHAARAEIEERLGTSGMKVIGERFQQSCEVYVQAVPQIFKGGVVLDPETKQKVHFRSTLLQRNPWVDSCRPHIRAKLQSFYAGLSLDTSISREHIGELARVIVPLAGFTGGGVYTVDPTLNQLIPQLTIGRPILRPLEVVQCGRISDPIAGALESIEPKVIEPSAENPSIMAMAGVIGYSQRVGVLYLELPQILFRQDGALQLKQFKAFAQALNDTLKLA